MNPLNPNLFNALTALFGHVRISNEGEERRVDYFPSYTTGRIRLRPEVNTAGEEYRINCPFCGDTRGRLYVNHCYGQPDPTTGIGNYYLIHCFNQQQCHLRPENRDRFKQMLEVDVFWARSTPAPVRSTNTTAPEPPRTFELPSGFVPVNQLPPDHPAAKYLADRLFDLTELSDRWQIGYCPAAPETHPPVYDRIVIPIYRLPILQSTSRPNEVVLAGWQARFVGDPPDGTPKYLFAAGFRKSKVLYGLTQAITTTGPVVVCEGPTDVWRFHSNAVALFGKTMSDEQRRLLRHHFEGRPIVIALDKDAPDEADDICTRLRNARWGDDGDIRVLRLELPDGGKDPADFSREALGALLERIVSTAPTGIY